MEKNKFLVSMLIVILIFFSFSNIVKADNEEQSEIIEETIEKDEGGLFEKVIAKIIRRNCISNI